MNKNFLERIRSSKRIIVANPGGIGDDIHLLPALDVIRQFCPEAKFDLLASDGSAPLLSAIDGVDQVFTVKWSPRFKDRAKKRMARWMALKYIAFSKYDAFIDFRPSDATQLFLIASRAPVRLGIDCMYWDVKRPGLYTDVVHQYWTNDSSYEFMLRGLGQVGFDIGDAHIGPHLLPKFLQANIEYKGCIHVSLCTSANSRELSILESRNLVEKLCRNYPCKKILITGMATDRESEFITNVVNGLNFVNLDVAVGRFTILELLGVLLAADIHIGPDTGTVHMAWLCGTPSVSWYLNHETLMAWMPKSPRHTVLVSPFEQSRRSSFMKGIGAIDILNAVDQRLKIDSRKLSIKGNPDIHFLMQNSNN